MARGGKLTLKQAKFAHEYISNGGNGVQAAFKAYDTESYDSANTMAQYNLADPDIQSIIQEAFAELRTTPKKYIKKLDKIAEMEITEATPETILKANIEMLKLARVYPGVKNTNINVSMKVKDMTLKEAQTALQSLRSGNDELLEEINTSTSPQDIIDQE